MAKLQSLQQGRVLQPSPAQPRLPQRLERQMLPSLVLLGSARLAQAVPARHQLTPRVGPPNLSMQWCTQLLHFMPLVQ